MDAWSRLELIRWKLMNEELPRDGAARMWAGYGHGDECSACGQPIEDSEVEYELEFPVLSRRHTVRLHRVCCEVWNAERVTFSAPIDRHRSLYKQMQ